VRRAVFLLLALCGCKSKDKEPPKITLEQLQQAQANTAALGNNPGGAPRQPVGSVDNPNAASGVGLPVEASARTLAIAAPQPLVPEPDSEVANTSATYQPGDRIRFRTRVTGFTLQQGESSFEFEWSITDASGKVIVSDRKNVVQRFLPDQGYSPAVTHRPAGLAGGKYTINVKVTDNKAAFLVREAQAVITYGVPSAPTAGALTIKDLVFTSGKAGTQVAGQPISFDFTVLGLLADATNKVGAQLDVKLTGNGQNRVLPPAQHAGALTPEGTFPLSVRLDGVPTGTYTLQVTVLDTSNEHVGRLEQPLTVQ